MAGVRSVMPPRISVRPGTRANSCAVRAIRPIGMSYLKYTYDNGDPCGIRTRDLLDENQISWTTRRRGQFQRRIMVSHLLEPVQLGKKPKRQPRNFAT